MARNAKGSAGPVRNVLTLKEAIALHKIIEARYTSSGLDNSAFAHSINSIVEERKLFREDVNAGHIMTAITAADIPNNYKVQAAARAKERKLANPITMILRVQKLEEQVAELMKLCKFPTK